MRSMIKFQNVLMEITGPLTNDAAYSSASKGHEIDIDFQPGLGALNLACLGEAESEQRATLRADPDDHNARFQLAALALVNGDFTASLADLVDILRRREGWEQRRARRALAAVFETPGADHDLVRQYRGELFQLLH